MLAALRRRLVVITSIIVTTQSLLLALGTAQVCADGEHTHAGNAAPDCAMHNHHPGAASGPADVHRGHAQESEGGHRTTAQINCHCSNDVPPTYLGYSAIVEQPAATVPRLKAAPLTPPAAPPFCDYDVPPPSPPPR